MGAVRKAGLWPFGVCEEEQGESSIESLMIVREESFRKGTGRRRFAERVSDVEDPGDELGR